MPSSVASKAITAAVGSPIVMGKLPWQVVQIQDREDG
jgi:hypothetical protein